MAVYINTDLYYENLRPKKWIGSTAGDWKKGERDIDVVALNEFDHTGLIAEVKRNEHKLNISKLEEKVRILPQAQFGKYTFELKGLSLKDM